MNYESSDPDDTSTSFNTKGFLATFSSDDRPFI